MEYTPAPHSLAFGYYASDDELLTNDDTSPFEAYAFGCWQVEGQDDE